MRIARILGPVHGLGPGERLCLWMQGCSKKCEGCISPEMQPSVAPELDNRMVARLTIDMARKNHCMELTISGGDPLEQGEDLLEYLQLVRSSFRDILVYTGFTMQEILNEDEGSSKRNLLSLIDVLIDGRYIEALNTDDCALRGSSNQVIHFLNPNARERYEEYLKKGRIREPFLLGDRVVMTGIRDNG